MSWRVRRFDDAGAFLARAEAWLLRDEAANTLVLGIAYRLRESREGFEEPIYLAVVEDADGVAGCAFRTPPFKLGVTRIPEAALPALMDDVAAVYPAIPAVTGPEPTSGEAARRWSERTGAPARPGMRQRIYRLDRVSAPDAPPSGRFRVAGEEDAELLEAWWVAFHAEAALPAHRVRESMAAKLRAGDLFLWEDGGPCALVGIAARTPNGARIGPVYTPPDRRGRGYASACTAEASRRVLEGGRVFCCLFTDMANPTSNSIYRRIGYRPVCDWVDWELDDSP